MQGTFCGEGVKLMFMYAENQLFIYAFELPCIYTLKGKAYFELEYGSFLHKEWNQTTD